MTENETDKERALRAAFQMHRDIRNIKHRKEEIRVEREKLNSEYKSLAQKLSIAESQFDEVMIQAQGV